MSINTFTRDEFYLINTTSTINLETSNKIQNSLNNFNELKNLIIINNNT